LREPLGRPVGLPDWPGLNNQGFCCASVLSVFGPAVQDTLEAEGIEFLVGDAPGVRLHPKKRK